MGDIAAIDQQIDGLQFSREHYDQEIQKFQDKREELQNKKQEQVSDD